MREIDVGKQVIGIYLGDKNHRGRRGRWQVEIKTNGDMDEK